MGLFEDRDRRAAARAEAHQAESDWVRQGRLRDEQNAREQEARAKASDAMSAAKAARKPYDLIGLRFAPTDGGILVSFVESDARVPTAKVADVIYDTLHAVAQGLPSPHSREGQAEKYRLAEQARLDAEAKKLADAADAAKAEELKKAERIVNELEAAKALLKAAGKAAK